jgi:glycosyltransferase involved in cell wall biosynthesis
MESRPMSSDPASHDNRQVSSESTLSTEPSIDLSIIAPAHNEQGNISGLLDDVENAMSGEGIRFEMILVDDGSTDQTASVMAREAAPRNWLRCYAMANTPHGSGNGQSAAFNAGVRLARGGTIALLDADRQNDPSDLPAMLKAMADTEADMVQGDRSANRQDSLVRGATSWVGRTFRRVMLGDTIRDTGCSLRVLRREVGLALPLQYKGMHRFIPFYARQLGYRVVEFPVQHRPRMSGVPKYGVWNRALPGLRDLFAVRWMRNRLRDTATRPIEPLEPS